MRLEIVMNDEGGRWWATYEIDSNVISGEVCDNEEAARKSLLETLLPKAPDDISELV